MPKQRILVIDDEKIILDLMQTIFSKEGYEVQCADHGELGLQMFHEQAPDLLIVDIAMPEVNGYHVIKHIRQHEGDTSHTPIIVLTAFPESVIYRDLDDKGADLHLTKPISPTELLKFVHRLLGDQSSA